MIQKVTLIVLNIFDYFHKKKIFRFLKIKNLTNFDIFFDIGAHAGETISSFGKNLNLKVIYSFEASPISFQILNNNLKKIQSTIPNSQINIENFAVGSLSKKIKIKHFIESSSSTIKKINTSSKYFQKKKKLISSLNNLNYFKEIDVNQISLDEYIIQKNIKRIDFLKIDTEGSEYDVIMGVTKNLKNIKLILFEHHFDDMISKEYKFSHINNLLIQNNFKQIFKIKMPFRKTFEYIYLNKTY